MYHHSIIRYCCSVWLLASLRKFLYFLWGFFQFSLLFFLFLVFSDAGPFIRLECCLNLIYCLIWLHVREQHLKEKRKETKVLFRAREWPHANHHLAFLIEGISYKHMSCTENGSLFVCSLINGVWLSISNFNVAWNQHHMIIHLIKSNIIITNNECFSACKCWVWVCAWSAVHEGTY